MNDRSHHITPLTSRRIIAFPSALHCGRLVLETLRNRAEPTRNIRRQLTEPLGYRSPCSARRAAMRCCTSFSSSVPAHLGSGQDRPSQRRSRPLVRRCSRAAVHARRIQERPQRHLIMVLRGRSEVRGLRTDFAACWAQSRCGAWRGPQRSEDTRRRGERSEPS